MTGYNRICNSSYIESKSQSTCMLYSVQVFLYKVTGCLWNYCVKYFLIWHFSKVSIAWSNLFFIKNKNDNFLQIFMDFICCVCGEIKHIEASRSSSLSLLSSGRSERPMNPIFSLLCFFLEFPTSIIQSKSLCLGLPMPFLPSSLPSIMSLYRESPLMICPIQFSVLF